MNVVTVNNCAPYVREFVLPGGGRVKLDPGLNKLPPEVVDGLLGVERFQRLLKARYYGIEIVEGDKLAELARKVEEGELDLNQFKVAERVKIIEHISDPTVLEALAEKSTSVTVNKAIAKRLRQLRS